MYRISALNTRGLESKNAGFLVGDHSREVNIQGRSQLQFFPRTNSMYDVVD